MQPSAFTCDLESLQTQFPDLPQWKVTQIHDWIYNKRVASPDDMSNVAKPVRERLKVELDWTLPKVVERVDSPDGASKLLLKDPQGRHFEAVILRYDKRVSLCVSSQVGCKLACRFCQTGKLGFVRHLSAGEIIGQFVLAQQVIAAEERKISHIVFMGMGEPLDNYDPVMATVKSLTQGFGLNPKNVTVSTSGIVPAIEKMIDDVPCALALSLHACRDELRTSLMPINKRWPLARLKEALLKWQKASGKTLTLEYILIKDLNCGLREAKELVKFLHGFKAKVNLIPFNSHPGMPYQRPDDEDIRAFQKYITDRSYPAPVRYSKGLEASAACGQLAAKAGDALNQVPNRNDLLGRSTAVD